MLRKGLKLVFNQRSYFLRQNLTKKNIIKKKLIKLPLNNFSNNNNDENLYEKFLKESKKIFRKSKFFYRNNKNKSIFLGSIFGLIFFSLLYKDYFMEKMDYNDFLLYLKNNLIEEIEFINFENKKKNYCLVKLENKKYKLNIFDSYVLKKKIDDINKKKTKKIIIKIKNSISIQNIFDNTFLIFKIATLCGIVYMVGFSKMKDPMNLSNFQKTSAKKYIQKKTNTKFNDVAGLKNEKREISEFVDFLTRPEKYYELGAKIPKGALLAGPPGTGKTLLAKACAGESNVNFYYTSGSEFVEMFVGVGAARVRDLFEQARKNSPSIIFFDEIDAIGKKRNSQGSNSEADSTLNQLLVEMDGFGTKENVVVFGATNRKELLDDALVRPGRFDRIIDVNLPDLIGREEIFLVHLRPLKMEEGMKRFMAKRLASLTPGFSGADISNICNEAAILAVRNNHETVEKIDFEMAVERVIGGLEKKSSVSEEERKTVAVHESGHGVISWFLKGADPLLKLTIIPRSKGSLGFAQYLPKENSLQTKEELEDKIVAILAGRVAEEEFFNKITSGAYDDFQKAYNIARSIITKLGMNKKLGYVSLKENEQGYKIFSEKTNSEIDKQCMEIIKKMTKKCRKMVLEHKSKIQQMSDVLLEKETIDLKIIVGILGQRKFENSNSFEAYLKESLG